MTKNYKALYRKLGYQFQNQALFELALTHRSMSAGNNERLEFLGDSILNFAIAARLFEQFPEAQEGELSRLRASLVNGKTLMELAQHFAIGDYLILGAGELKTGGHQRRSILADAMEAIIGAMFIESGMDVCRKIILQWYADKLKHVQQSGLQKDPKTQLQEYLQAKHLTLPKYDIIQIDGDAHAQVFQIKCNVSALKKTAEGSGRSRRAAEQAAAENMLKLIK